ncbi:hypothetical protein RHMOL_Rhmol03G0059400 [Rhododendron molle]|uniref:Uncharacterized protein n=1 Tax=Rhododendron molle TaxID=49168 RepID=A0ACC0PDC4_RHOML|nr:hypothetical protein RHMOL_Rhmol03G0059400 [Rhododendron molle]
MAATINLACESDCKEIHESLGNLSHLTQALATKSQIQRTQIREKYMEMYSEDLINCLRMRTTQLAKSEGNELGESSSATAGSALALWMLDPVERDAVVAREALDQKSEITNFRALVEMFVGRKSSHVVLIKQVYQVRFGRVIDQDILCIEPPHDPYKKILVALVASHKAHHADLSQHIAKCDARRLYQTGEGRSGAIDEAVVLELLSKRSIPQLNLTFSTYKHIYGHGYSKSLKNENYGEFEAALDVVVKCIYNPPKYYAQTLYGSIKGMTKDKCGLARVMLSRAEVDMDEIQRVYRKKYGVGMIEAICESIPAGDYRDFLVALARKASTTASAFS